MLTAPPLAEVIGPPVRARGWSSAGVGSTEPAAAAINTLLRQGQGTEATRDRQYYAEPVSTPTAPNGECFEVVVGTDGALTVAAEELARHGVRPGAHLRLVQEPQPPAPKRSARGALAEVINSEELDAFEVALDNSKSERIAAAKRRWA